MRIFSLCAALVLAASPLMAQTSDTETDSAATCVLSFNGKIYSEGPCEGTFFEEGVTDVSGTVEESGQAWQIVIDEEKGSGVLIGANAKEAPRPVRNRPMLASSRFDVAAKSATPAAKTRIAGKTNRRGP